MADPKAGTGNARPSVADPSRAIAKAPIQTVLIAPCLTFPDEAVDTRPCKRRGRSACSRRAYSGNGGASPSGSGTWNTLSVFPISV